MSAIEENYMVPEAINENTRSIAELTFRGKIGMWMPSMGRNMKAIVEGPSLEQLKNKIVKTKRAGSAVVIGGGPSIEKYGHLDLLAKSNYDGLIITCDRNLVPCLKRGIIPDVVASLDGDPVVANFYKSPLIKDCIHKTKAVFCAQAVHPDVLARWTGETYWFIAIWDSPFLMDPPTIQCPHCKKTFMNGKPVVLKRDEPRPTDPRSLTLIFHFMTQNKTMFQTLGNVGATSWNMAYYFERNPVALVGFDMSYLPNINLKKTLYYQTFKNMLKATGKYSKENLMRFFRKDYNPDFHTYRVTDLMFESYSESLKHLVSVAKQVSHLKTVNCTGAGLLHGPMVTGMQFKQFLEETKK